MNHRRCVIGLCVACVFGAANAAPKTPVSIKSGFHTGSSFRELSSVAKRSYVAGFVDGALVAPLLDAPKGEIRWLERCVTGMTDDQLVAIVEKWLSENPVRWHESMNILAFVALKEGCTK
ncbi:Rap1a/Tai family immunity protein [Methylibium rhizosphaerae]|uniref:Rap1a/Tai family immunity protein n=1 Tax=Methylibium rhizosphaerae TaxID=2570323 RepID=UPI00112B9DDD|nr:Rap1a/Tai family immunity protein [Methylibium rhizosphaerae]